MPTYKEPDIAADTTAIKPEPEKDKKPAKNKKATKRPGASRTTDKQIKDALDQIWIGIGGATMAFNPWDGAVLIANGPKVTDALVDVSKENPRLRQALEAFVKTSAWGAVAAAFAGVAIPIAANHGQVPAIVAMPFAPDHDTVVGLIGEENTAQAYARMMGGTYDPDAENVNDEGD